MRKDRFASHKSANFGERSRNQTLTFGRPSTFMFQNRKVVRKTCRGSNPCSTYT